MSVIIFISQEQMEKYVNDGVADINGNDIVLRLEKTYIGNLEEAYYFLRNVVNPSDPRGMINRVFTKGEIKDLNADIMQNSVIIGEDVYDVEEGFVVYEQGNTLTDESTKKSQTQEIKSLASFILKNLKSG
ncbi:MAG: hypothetical protein N2746_02640 [Deltaproteobacteria bacterium]|nr:hypothetical protein [Deltaproteobacteria bacterium]